MSDPQVTREFKWRREDSSLIATCSACPWFIENTGPVDTEDVRDKVIVRIARRHARDCAGAPEEQERTHAANRSAGRDPWDHGD